MILLCPECHQPIEVESPSETLSCAECGASIVQPDETTETIADGEQTLTYIQQSPPDTSIDLPRRDTQATRFGDYVVLAEIARGGMGVVFKARQVSLNRVVAIKVIRSGELADTEEIARFRTEAQAAAKLDHPNIVPIYEVGEQAGQHFFSMGYIEGRSLQDRLNDGPLALREAAELTRTIADAIAFAHQSGIVHRDLKPANVLLEADGTPRVTDFGLAKNIGGDSNMTATGQVIGTPAYMPPEQASGRTNEVGPLADVYSLGALLYALMTGRPPFQAANALETLKQVVEREPVAPRTLNPAVDRDLETICLKCLEKSPARRYASVAAVGEELDRYLTGRPIQARPVGPVHRLYRWCRRNPWATVAITASMLLAVGGSVAAVWQRQLQNEAVYQRGRADQKVLDLQQALNQKSIEERRASRNLNHAVEVVDYFLTKVGREGGVLSRYPNTQPIRRDLLEAARDYYSKFIEENRTAALSPKLASASFRLGGILALLGEHDKALRSLRDALAIEEKALQGNPEDPRPKDSIASILHNIGIELSILGRPKAALVEYQRGLSVRKALMAEYPDIRDYRIGVARLLNGVGKVNSDLGNSREALEAYRNARDLWKQLHESDSENRLFRSELARAHYNIALQKNLRGEHAEALADYQNALTLRDDLAKQFPGEPDYQDDLAAVLHNLGMLYGRLKRPELADSSLNRALRIREQLANDNPSVPQYRNGLAKVKFTLAQMRSASGKHSAALEALNAAISLRRKLTESNRASIDQRESLAKSLTAKANLLSKLGRFAEAETSLREAVTIREQLIQQAPDSFLQVYGLAKAYESLGEFHNTANQHLDALPRFRAAIKIVDRLAKKDPNNSELAEARALLYRSAGISNRRLRRFKDAAADLETAFALRTRLVKEHPHESHTAALAQIHESRGHLFQDTGRTDDALREYERGLDIYRRLQTGAPKNSEYRVAAALLRSSIAGVHADRGRREAAIEQEEAAVAIWKALQREFPDVVRYRAGLASSSGNLAISYRYAGKLENANAQYEKSIATYRQLAREHPTRQDFQLSLANAYNNLADLQLAKRKPQQALETWRKAETIQRKLVTSAPDRPEYRFDLVLTLRNIGSTLRQVGKESDALPAFVEATALAERLTKEFPAVAKYHIRLAGCLDEMAQAWYARGDLKRALDVYDRTIAIQEKLIKRYPQQATYAYRLAGTLNNSGRLLQKAGRIDDARKNYTRALGLRQQLLRRFPDSSRYRLGVAWVKLNLGNLLREQDPPASLKYCEEAAGEFEILRKRQPQFTLFRTLLRDAHWCRGQVFNARENYQQAEVEWRAAVKLNHRRFAFSDSLHLAYSLARIGKTTDALKIARQLKAGAKRGDSCYRCAKVFAVSFASKSRSAGKEPVPARQQVAADAVALLHKAEQAGYFATQESRQRLHNEPDFEGLRKRRDFQQLLQKVGPAQPAPARARIPVSSR